MTMAKGPVRNSMLLEEAAKMIAEHLKEEVCDIMARDYDGATYCQTDCPRTADDGCVLHLLRMKCADEYTILE